MRVLYLCPDHGIPVLGGKGGAVHVRAMVAAFDRAGHQVTVAAPRGRTSPWEPPVDLCGEFVELPVAKDAIEVCRKLGAYLDGLGVGGSLARDVRRMLYDLDSCASLPRSFGKAPPDFIYARASLFATASVALAAEIGRPLLVELNAPLAAEQATYRSGALPEVAARSERALLTGAHAVLAVSAPLREHAIALGVAPERVYVVPNGIDPALFCPGERDPAVRRRLGLGIGPVLGFVGGLRPWHGVEHLPELLARVSARYPEVQLAVVGDGPLRSELKQRLAKLRMDGRAVLVGALPHEDVPAVIRQFDVALAPYPNPAHDFYFSPLKLFEYMACGVPVAAPRLGQIAEVLRDGETGLLYPPGNLDEFAAACDRLIADPDYARRLGSAAAREVAECYTWDRNAARATELARRFAEAKDD